MGLPSWVMPSWVMPARLLIPPWLTPPLAAPFGLAALVRAKRLAVVDASVAVGLQRIRLMVKVPAALRGRCLHKDRRRQPLMPLLRHVVPVVALPLLRPCPRPQPQPHLH